MANGMKEI